MSCHIIICVGSWLEDSWGKKETWWVPERQLAQSIKDINNLPYDNKIDIVDRITSSRIEKWFYTFIFEEIANGCAWFIIYAVDTFEKFKKKIKKNLGP